MENGRTCNRKVMENGVCPVCDKQGKTAVRLMPRCQFADATGGIWMTAFDQAAQAVLGHTGEQIRDADKGGDKLEALFATEMYKAPFKLTLRAKAEEYQGERKPRVDCIDAKPVSWRDHGAACRNTFPFFLFEASFRWWLRSKEILRRA